MNDVIRIQGLEVQTKIGVPDEERATEQRVLISVDMHTDTEAAGKADDVSQSIDYAAVAETIAAAALEERNTLERFAEDIATLILKKFAPTSVGVSVQKFVVPHTQAVSVSIVRP